jgi:hypothetical protein
MTSQYGAHELHAGKARLYTRIRMHTPTLSGTRTHERAHTHKNVIFIAFPRQQWFANAPVCYVMVTLSFWMSNLAAARKHFSLCPFTTPRHCDWAKFIVKSIPKAQINNLFPKFFRLLGYYAAWRGFNHLMPRKSPRRGKNLVQPRRKPTMSQIYFRYVLLLLFLVLFFRRIKLVQR